MLVVVFGLGEGKPRRLAVCEGVEAVDVGVGRAKVEKPESFSVLIRRWC